MSAIYQLDTSIQPVTVDLYRDIHKGIRAELFAVTLEAGRTDPADRPGRQAVAAHWQDIAGVLVTHAEHEDTHMQPAIETHLPDLAVRIERDHLVLESRIEWLTELSQSIVGADASEQGARMHQLYLELASFTSAYLEHQDAEERLIGPALEAAIGIEQAAAIHQAIISSIPPDEMERSLAFMLPAMNLDDRAEMLGAMRAGAPAEVFEGVWGLARSVLSPADHAALGSRLGIA